MYHKIIIAIMALVVGYLPTTTIAAELRAGEQTLFGASERLSDDLYMVGGNVNAEGVVTGDTAAAGGNVLINGSVSQDVAAAGGSVNILADVGDDLRVGGGNILISGAVGGDVLVGGGQVQISGTGVTGDVIWAGGIITISAPVGGDLQLAGGEVYINAPVAGNVSFKGDKLTLGAGAVISGSLTYTAAQEVEMQEGAAVLGEVSYQESQMVSKMDKDTAAQMVFGIISLALFVGFLMKLVAALVVGLVFRRYSTALVAAVACNPFTEMGRGFAMLVLLPIAAIILMVTVIGLPLGFIALIGFAGLALFASILAPVLLGSFVHKAISKQAEYKVSWKTILLGVVLYSVLGLIPIIGWIVKLGLVLVSAGAMMKLKWGIIKEMR
jgi:cytoskeletal protein CcmA (bactofilin family)